MTETGDNDPNIPDGMHEQTSINIDVTGSCTSNSALKLHKYGHCLLSRTAQHFDSHWAESIGSVHASQLQMPSIHLELTTTHHSDNHKWIAAAKCLVSID